MKYEIGWACNTRGVGDKHVQTFCREARTDGGDLGSDRRLYGKRW